MSSLLILIPAFIILAVVIGFVWYRRRGVAVSDIKPARFRWRYIALPLILFLLTGVMVAFFYGRLPDRVAYHFMFDGAPDRWTSPAVTAIIGLAVQGAMVWIGWLIVRITSRLSPAGQADNAVLKPESLLLWMGNLVALPQIIFGFVMLELFSYNVYQVHLMPVWLFMVIVLVIATLGFIGFLIYVTLKALRQANKDA